MITVTSTYALMEVTRATYIEIAKKLHEAGYAHAFDSVGEHGICLDMDGIGLKQELGEPPSRCQHDPLAKSCTLQFYGRKSEVLNGPVNATRCTVCQKSTEDIT